MKSFFIVLISLLAFISLKAAEYQEWINVRFDPSIVQLRLLVQDGTIEAPSNDANQGWMLASDYAYYSNYFDLQKLASEMREVKPIQISLSPDSVGEVLATFPMPPGVPSERGMGYDGTYFYVVSAQTNSEKIFKLDPNNNFAVVSSFPSPGTGSHLPWGIDSDGHNLYIADALQDLIFKTDTSGAILTSFATGGPITSGLGYRTNELWNGDLGDITMGIPPKVYKLDTLGTPLTSYTQSTAVNGLACSDSAVLIGRNINNGHDIRAVNPANFAQLYTFTSPLDYPNGLAFDGTYLWICGRTSGVQYIVKVDIGLGPIVGVGEPPLVTENKLYSNYPNPFNPTTTINFSVAGNSNVTLQVFNIAGQLVKTLANQRYSGGSHSVVWDGTNDRGNLLSSGIYFYRLKIGEKFVQTKRMLLLK